MPNTLGTLSASIVTMRVFQFLRLYYGNFFRSIATDFSNENSLLNQQVVSRVAKVPTVQDYSTANGYEAADAETVDVPVTINQHKHVTLAFNLEEMTKTSRNLVDEQAGPAAYALGKNLVDAVLGVITTANFTNQTVETVANTDRSTLGKLRKALNGRGVGLSDRFTVMNADAFENLTDDTRIISRDFNPNATQAEQALGFLSGIQGFAGIHEYPDFPATDNLTGFAGTRDSLVIATRLPRDPAALVPGLPLAGQVQVISDPDTGMSMLVRAWYDFKMGKLYYSLVWMYGVAVGVADNGQRLVHTDPGA